MANAHALDESCRPVVEEMIRKGGAKAIAVASSYGDGQDRVFLDSPKAEWLWEFAEANDILVHIHPPMMALGHESLMQYRLNEAVGRPFDATVTAARMIGSGVFDRHPKLQVLVVHMGGGPHRSSDASISPGTLTTTASPTLRPAGLTRTSGRHPTTARPTSWST
jgi:predicted TIM-barrel fold metal-dependent hydrolase